MHQSVIPLSSQFTYYFKTSLPLSLLLFFPLFFPSFSLSSFLPLPLPLSLSLSLSPFLPLTLSPFLPLSPTACPGPVTLADSDLGGLANLLSVKLSCTTQFTNVLTMRVELICKQINVTPSLTLDEESLVHNTCTHCCVSVVENAFPLESYKRSTDQMSNTCTCTCIPMQPWFQAFSIYMCIYNVNV